MAEKIAVFCTTFSTKHASYENFFFLLFSAVVSDVVRLWKMYLSDLLDHIGGILLLNSRTIGNADGQTPRLFPS